MRGAVQRRTEAEPAGGKSERRGRADACACLIRNPKLGTMSLRDQPALRVVLYEGNGARPLQAADRFAAMSALLEKGFVVTRVAGEGRVASADSTSLLVLGRFDGGKPPQAEDADGQVNLRFHDIDGFDANRVSEIVE